jgi:hypothetical protein
MEARLQADAEEPPEIAAEGAQDPAVDHVNAPEQERDVSEELHQDIGRGHAASSDRRTGSGDL